ncbi:MAG: hypothetical protein JSR17_05160 [Proteobacteria bacterium]|nr:hypothetical protein [Pseudomonadota bacterium]
MYTPFQVAKVFSVIREYLLTNPLVFAKEGVFRVPGTDANSQKIVADILSKDKKVEFPSTKNPDNIKVHDYLSALKLVLNGSKLLDPNELNVEMLKAAMEESKDPSMAAHELDEYIHNLIISSDIREQAAGEVFYTYFQLAKVALACQDKNRMTAENLGMVIGPNFEKMISQDKDPLSVFKLIQKLNAICTLMLQGGTYEADFEKKYYPSMISMRLKQKAICEQEKSEIEAVKANYAKKKAEHHQKIAAKKNALRKARRDVKKRLQAEIKESEEILAELEQDDIEHEKKIKAIEKEELALAAEIEELNGKYAEQQVQLSATHEQQLREIAGALVDLTAANEPPPTQEIHPATALVLSSPKALAKDEKPTPETMAKRTLRTQRRK